MRRRHAPAVRALTAVLALATLACTCGQLPNLREVLGAARTVDSEVRGLAATYGPTLEAGITEIGPTLEAGLTQIGPTLQAGATSLVQQATEHGPALEATVGALIATSDAWFAQQRRSTPGATPVGTPPPPADSPGTPLVEWIGFAQPHSARIDDPGVTHSWLFEGAAGQVVAASIASTTASPSLQLVAPDGAIVAESTAEPGVTIAWVTATLPATGVYTVRVGLSAPADYTLVVNR